MLIELPIFWIVALNVGGWLIIQLGLAWAFLKLPTEWFNPGEVQTWERDGHFYETVLLIKRWKDRLPDAAGWFRGGFKKSRLAGIEPDYLRRFIRETWRGELCHWLAIACAPLFFLWNPWWGDFIIASYAAAANLPCILTQRYNRSRFQRMLAGSLKRASQQSCQNATD